MNMLTLVSATEIACSYGGADSRKGEVLGVVGARTGQRLDAPEGAEAEGAFGAPDAVVRLIHVVSEDTGVDAQSAALGSDVSCATRCTLTF